MVKMFLSRLKSHQFLHFSFFGVRFAHLMSFTMFLLDLALLIFNLEMYFCWLSNYNTNVYMEQIMTTDEARVQMSLARLTARDILGFILKLMLLVLQFYLDVNQIYVGMMAHTRLFLF